MMKDFKDDKGSKVDEGFQGEMIISYDFFCTATQ